LPARCVYIAGRKKGGPENSLLKQRLATPSFSWHATCKKIGQRLTANEVPDTARRAFIEAKKPIESGRVQQKDRVKNLLLYISDYNTKGEVERPPRPPFSITRLLFKHLHGKH